MHRFGIIKNIKYAYENFIFIWNIEILYALMKSKIKKFLKKISEISRNKNLSKISRNMFMLSRDISSFSGGVGFA